MDSIKNKSIDFKLLENSPPDSNKLINIKKKIYRPLDLTDHTIDYKEPLIH